MKKEPPPVNPTLGGYLADRFKGFFKPGVDLSDWDPDAKSRKRMEEEQYMANGGIVQPMPQHWDKMSWQRVSFKK
jgi:hypothetical protein